MSTTTPNPSTSTPAASAATLITIPAGLELVYESERPQISSAVHAFVLGVHWAIVRAGLRLRSSGSTDQEFTERLPPGWSNLVDQVATGKLILNYVDPLTNVTYEFKIVEVSPGQTLVVTVFRQGASSAPPATAAAAGTSTSKNTPATGGKSPQNTSASSFQIADYVNQNSFPAPGTTSTPRSASVTSTYSNAAELERKVWTELFEPIGLHVLGQPPVLGPYEDKTKKPEEEKKTQQPEVIEIYDEGQFYQPGLERRPSPLHPRPLQPGGIGVGTDPMNPLGGGLGRSDLDPLGRFGAGNIADPRGFRNPAPPMGIGPGPGRLPPGARFDPFGPVPPGGGFGPPGAPGRGGGRPRPGNFGQPNPDHEQPPPDGFDDMFM